MSASPVGPGGIPAIVVERLRAARRVTVLTGAGISAESGVPTFRDAGTGLWARYRPEDLATPEAFEADPKLVWKWYEWRRGLIAQAQPNPGHHALVEWERRVPRFTLVTQNVDGLHRLAGSRRVLELHGNIWRTKCYREDVPVENWNAREVPPCCPDCGGPLRPDVVWFGERLPAETLQEAFEEASASDALLCVGTSALVYPAASLPDVALAAGNMVIEINPACTALSGRASASLQGKAGEVLPRLLAAIWPER